MRSTAERTSSAAAEPATASVSRDTARRAPSHTDRRTGDTTTRVELIDLNSDLGVANAAYVSTDRCVSEFGERQVGLLDYLARHHETTPFRHPHVSFRITAPLFVARQLAKHQVGMSWSEESRRYVRKAPPFARMVWRERATQLKQGSGGQLTGWRAVVATAAYWTLCYAAELAYFGLLRLRVSPEQARVVLPQALMTTWVWTGTLLAWAHLCWLRCDEKAQSETREVAEAIEEHMAARYPYAWTALTAPSSSSRPASPSRCSNRQECKSDE